MAVAAAARGERSRQTDFINGGEKSDSEGVVRGGKRDLCRE